MYDHKEKDCPNMNNITTLKGMDLKPVPTNSTHQKRTVTSSDSHCQYYLKCQMFTGKIYAKL